MNSKLTVPGVTSGRATWDVGDFAVAFAGAVFVMGSGPGGVGKSGDGAAFAGASAVPGGEDFSGD